MGTIGLLVAHLALSLNYQVLVTDRIQEKVELAVSWGAQAANVENTADPIRAFKDMCEQAKVRAVFEATGSGKGTQFTLESAPRGAEARPRWIGSRGGIHRAFPTDPQRQSGPDLHDLRSS